MAERTSSGGGAGLLTGLASALALLFSGISLYHSVLKQPDIRVYVPNTVHYTRDSAVDGEVFILPVTVANHGARDGTVLQLQLTARSGDGATTKTFEATYAVGEDFFVKPAGLNASRTGFERVDRPRTPFAPISVAGRSHFTGTLLFYRTSGEEYPRIIDEAGQHTLTLSVKTTVDTSLGPIDALMTRPTPDVALLVSHRRRADDRRLKRGATLPLRVSVQEPARRASAE
ncbi:MAG: hypothetical protein AAGG99_05420 [Pseudomonadota bacterium]